MIRSTLLAVLCCWITETVYGQNVGRKADVFHTVGYDYHRQKIEVEESGADALEIEGYTDEGNVCEPSLNSMKVHIPMVSLPLEHIHITSPFGMRRDPLNPSSYRYHAGLDLRAHNDMVYAMLPGVVTAASYSENGGKYITISHGVCSCSYLHLSKIKVMVGQHVSAGQVIGVSGNTGKRTTGPHLHLSCRLNDSERKFFNPMLILGFVSDQLLNCQTSK